jgi:hypothetical protein
MSMTLPLSKPCNGERSTAAMKLLLIWLGMGNPGNDVHRLESGVSRHWEKLSRLRGLSSMCHGSVDMTMSALVR